MAAGISIHAEKGHLFFSANPPLIKIKKKTSNEQSCRCLLTCLTENIQSETGAVKMDISHEGLGKQP